MRITAKFCLLAGIMAALVVAVLAIQYGSAAVLQTKQQWLAALHTQWLGLNREILTDLSDLSAATEHRPADDAESRRQRLAGGTMAMRRFHAALDELAELARRTSDNGREERDEPEVALSAEILAARANLRAAADRLAAHWRDWEAAGFAPADSDPASLAARARALLADEVRPAALALQRTTEDLLRHENAETEAAAAAIRRQVLLLGSGTVFLVGLMVLLFHRDVVRPLRHLAAVARGIRPGITHPPFRFPRTDEIGEVAAAFDQMLGTLEATMVSRDELEHMVEARTAELNRLSLVAAHTTNLVVITDAAGRIESVNAGFERVTGYTHAEVRGRKPGDFLQGPDTDPATVRLLRERLHAGQAVSTEILNYAKAGHTYWLQINIQPVHDAAGRLTHFIAIESEITERKRAAAELESYRNRLEIALAASNTCTFDLDLAAKEVRLDPRWSVMLGGVPVETRLPARQLLKLLPAAECRAALAHLADCEHGRSNEYCIEYPIRDLQGRWRWIHSRGQVTERDPGTGRARRIIGTNTDVTERKSAELATTRQIGFLRALNQITLDLLERRDLPDLLQALVEHATVLIEAPYGEVLLKEAGELVVRAQTRNLGARSGAPAGRADAPLAWQAHDSRLPVVLDAGTAAPAALPAGISAAAQVPILLGTECLGVLALRRNGTGRPFTDEEVELALVLSRLAALTVTNARVYADALRVAEARAAALLESEQIYRHLVENINQGFYTASARGIFTYCNPAISAVSGWTAAELAGTSSFRLVCDEDRPRVIAEYRRWARAADTDVTIEFRTDTKSGRRLWVEQITHIQRDPAGQVQEFRCFLRDISDRKAAEAALRESEERFHAVFDQSPVAIGLLTYPEGRIVEMNDAARRVFGVNRDQAIGRSSSELDLWADPAERSHYLQELQARGSVRGFEARMRRAGGEVFRALYTGSVIEIGGQTYSLNSIQDVTEWRRAEARFRDLFAFSPDAILIANHAGLILDANQRAEQLFECSRAELLGRHPTSLVPDEHRAAVAERLDLYLRQPRPLAMGTSGGGLHARSVRGRVFPIDVSLGPIHTDEGLLVVAALRDISRELEAASQLRQAQKMESLGTLAGGIAHDFNNILTGISGSAQLARFEVPDGHPAAEWLNHILRSGHRARDLVQQILTFSRKKEGQVAPVRLQTVVSEALGLLRSTLPAMIELRQEIDPACPPVLADGSQLHQVLMNLCTNSLHALPEANGRIVVGLATRHLPPDNAASPPTLRPGPHVVLTVEDNGHGMKPEIVERIFEPFFTTKEAGKGTGLGLAVVHGIVQSHGGAIAVRSTPGRGTRFDIFLPAIAVPVPEPGSTAPDQALPRGSGQRVLFVDDDAAAGSALSGLIEALGYRVTFFDSPLRALELVRSDPGRFDLLVTDLAMPDLPGNQLAARVTGLRPGLPVVLVTGYLEPGQEARILATGIRSILHKPVSLADLAGALQRALAP